MDLSEKLLGRGNETQSSVWGMILNVLLALILLVLIGVLCPTSMFALCRVNGTSMSDTLSNGQYVLVERGNAVISRGDIIIFAKTDSSGKTTQYIKRAVALGGDVVRFIPENEDGKRVVYLYVNGEKQADEYIREKMETSYWSRVGVRIPFEEDYKVPDGCIFALGDNRNNSKDSRYGDIGDVTADELVGRVDVLLEKDSFFEWLCKLVFGAYLRGSAPDDGR